MQNHPNISVIIPVYNVEKYLPKCLDSVINQTLHNLEIICVNDGSTDNSLSILKKFALKDTRIKIIDQKNGGLSKARNVGISAAAGDYLYFLDSDDFIELDAMKNLFAESSKNDLDVLYFDGDPFYEDENLKSKYSGYMNYYHRNFNYSQVTDGKTLYQKMYSANAFLPSACFQIIQRKYLLENGLSFLEGMIYEDNLFTFLTIINANRAKYIKKTYFHRRFRYDSIMTKAVSLENVRGYLTCLFHMLQFVMNQSFDNNLSYTIQKHLKSIIRNVIEIYSDLSAEEKNKFHMTASFAEKLFFDIFFLESELKKNSIFESEFSLTNNKNESIDIPKELIRVHKEINNLQKQLASIKGSVSFRIGRALTYIPRKLNDSIRSSRKHS